MQSHLLLLTKEKTEKNRKMKTENKQKHKNANKNCRMEILWHANLLLYLPA